MFSTLHPMDAQILVDVREEHGIQGKNPRQISELYLNSKIIFIFL